MRLSDSVMDDPSFCLGSTMGVSLRAPRLPSGLMIWKVWPCRCIGDVSVEDIWPTAPENLIRPYSVRST